MKRNNGPGTKNPIWQMTNARNLLAAAGAENLNAGAAASN